jgi:chromosome segregation ATPase
MSKLNSRSHLVTIISIVTAVHLLNGCCSNTTTDPTQGGLLGGVCGTTTGSYDRRIEERETRLAQIRGERAEAEATNVQLQRQAAQARRDVTSMQRRVNNARRDIQRMNASTSAQTQRKQQLLQQAQSLNGQLQRLQADPNATSQAYQQKKAELEKEIQQLSIIANSSVL